MRIARLHAVVALILFGGLAAAEDPAPLYDLGKVEGMQSFVGSEGARKLLARNGFVVTDQQFKQIFSAYITDHGGKPLPKFITTDSAWHTYHVLLEEGVRYLAEWDAVRLKQFSAALLTAALARNGEAKEGPYIDLARFAGIGLALQDPDAVKTMDARVKPDVESILVQLKGSVPLARIPSFGLPFSLQRLRAAGFYTRSPELRGYFAARQWCATSDFRAKSREETERAFRLALLIVGTPELKKLYADLSDPHDKLVGPGDDADVRTYASIAARILGESPKADDVPARLDALIAEASKLPDPLVNDQLLDPAQYANFAQETKGFRLFPPRRLPCAVTFQNTVDPLVKGRMFPSGVDLLAVGPLTSEAGRRAVKASAKSETEAKAILEAKSIPALDSLHGQALKLLAELQKPLPPAAPAALRTPAWHDKQLWTQLGAWAGERHTWALNAKINEHWMGMTSEPPGMVSPYPSFFAGLGRLAKSAADIISKAPPPAPPDRKVIGRKLLEGFQLIERRRRDREANQPVTPITEEDKEITKSLYSFLESYFEKRPERNKASDRIEMTEKLESQAPLWAENGVPDEILKFVMHMTNRAYDVPERLVEFAGLCDQLAATAAKHLSGQELDEQDARLIKGYGMKLARFHYYDGNSWLTPRDDFPIVAPVFVSPIRDEILYAGLARPEALYVIVESGGKQFLHRGAVLSYREFRRPMGQDMNDDTWKEEVLKDKIPLPPAFTASFRQPITEDEAVKLIRSGVEYYAVDTVPGRKVTRALLDMIKADHGNWWNLTHYCNRAGAEDVGDLIGIIEQSGRFSCNVAERIIQLPWKEHREALYKLLRNPEIDCADAAAYILSRKPEDIEVQPLVHTYDAQAFRTKRLYCYLLSTVKNPGDDVAGVFVRALSEKDAGLRHDAARAIEETRIKTPDTVKALIGRLEDPNALVAACAARALVTLDAREAAPAFLSRLSSADRSTVVEDIPEAHRDEIERATHPEGSHGPMNVLNSWKDEKPHIELQGQEINMSFPELGHALTSGLGSFAYRPAKPALENILPSKLGPVAVIALHKIDPEGHADHLIAVAVNTKSNEVARMWALHQVGLIARPELARKLAPALNDKDDTILRNWRFCDEAANAIAGNLGWKERITPKTLLKDKDAFIEKIRKEIGATQQ